jgi:hypothetical protein
MNNQLLPHLPSNSGRSSAKIISIKYGFFAKKFFKTFSLAHPRFSGFCLGKHWHLLPFGQ